MERFLAVSIAWQLILFALEALHFWIINVKILLWHHLFIPIQIYINISINISTIYSSWHWNLACTEQSQYRSCLTTVPN